MAKQVPDGLHRHIPANHLGRNGVSKHVGTGPRDGDAGATKRSLGAARHGRIAEGAVPFANCYLAHSYGFNAEDAPSPMRFEG